MTEKRFKWDIYDGDALFYEDNAVIDYDDVVDLLNENEQLKSEIKDFQELLAGKEEELLKPIRLTIQEAYETERTQIGKNVLKQLLEAIE